MSNVLLLKEIADALKQQGYFSARMIQVGQVVYGEQKESHQYHAIMVRHYQSPTDLNIQDSGTIWALLMACGFNVQLGELIQGAPLPSPQQIVNLSVPPGMAAQINRNLKEKMACSEIPTEGAQALIDSLESWVDKAVRFRQRP